jgi:hypothetical protein
MPKAYLHDYVYKLLETYEEEDLRKPRNPAKQFPGGVGSRENRRIDPCIEHIDPILVKSGEEWAFIPVSRHLLAFCPPDPAARMKRYSPCAFEHWKHI